MRKNFMQRLERVLSEQKETPVAGDAQSKPMTLKEAKAVARKIGLDSAEIFDLGNGHFSLGFHSTTPQQAFELLKLNIDNNRNETLHRVGTTSRMMRSSLWATTHESIIAFDDQARLFDVQHRLAGQVFANATITWEFRIYRPGAGLLVLNTGKSRTPHDNMQLCGRLDFTAQITGMCNAIMSVYRKNKLPDNFQLAELFADMKEPMEWALTRLPGKQKGIGRAPVKAAVAIASMHVDRAKLDAFCTHFKSKPYDNPGDSGFPQIHRYREALCELSGGGTELQVRSMMLTQAAIHNYVGNIAIPPKQKVAAAKEPIYPLVYATAGG